MLLWQATWRSLNLKTSHTQVVVTRKVEVREEGSEGKDREDKLSHTVLQNPGRSTGLQAAMGQEEVSCNAGPLSCFNKGFLFLSILYFSFYIGFIEGKDPLADKCLKTTNLD